MGREHRTVRAAGRLLRATLACARSFATTDFRPDLRAFEVPTLIIHGTADDVVPIQDGRDAFEAATCDKEWLEIEGAEHLFDEASYPKLVEAVDGFLGRHFN